MAVVLLVVGTALVISCVWLLAGGLVAGVVGGGLLIAAGVDLTRGSE